jgi:predicted GTPase
VLLLLQVAIVGRPNVGKSSMMCPDEVSSLPKHPLITCAAAEHTTRSSANHAFMLQVAIVGRPNVSKPSLRCPA